MWIAPGAQQVLGLTTQSVTVPCDDEDILVRILVTNIEEFGKRGMTNLNNVSSGDSGQSECLYSIIFMMKLI